MLDDLDKDILNLMLKGKGVKARLTELSEVLGRKRSTINLRVGKLEKEVIRGYKPRIDWEKLGYELTGYVGVICPDESIKELVEKLRREKSVFEIHEISAGTFDLLLKCRFKGHREIKALHNSIREILGVKDVDIWLLGPCYKEE